MLSGVVRLITNHQSSAPSNAHQKSAPFPPLALPSLVSTTTLSDAREGHRRNDVRRRDLRPSRASPNYPAYPPDMPCPLPRWTRADASVGCFSAPLGPSPYFRRVGVHDFTFEACSGFNRVTACRIAQPPKGGLCHEASARPVARPSRSSATRSYRQLPGWILPPLVNRAVGAH